MKFNALYIAVKHDYDKACRLNALKYKSNITNHKMLLDKRENVTLILHT